MYRNAAIYFAVRVVNGFIGLAALFVLTRLLSPEDYGTYALGLAAINVTAVLFFQWLTVSVARFYSNIDATTDDLITQAHVLFAIMSGVLAAVALAWAGLGADRLASPLAVAVIAGGAVATGLQSLHLQIANARGQPLRWGLITAVRAATALALAVIAIQLGWGPIGALAGVGLGCALALLAFGARWQVHAGAQSPHLCRRIAVYGLPLSLTYICAMALDFSDRFLIAAFHGTSGVAAYAAAADLVQQSAGAILNVFFLAGYPRVTSAWEASGAEGARRELLPMARALIVATPLVAAIFMGMSPEIARAMFGVGLRAEAAALMPWIAATVSIAGIKAYFLDVPAFHLRKATAMQLRVTAIIAVINVGLNIALIPQWGSLGAAIAGLVAYSCGAILSWWQGRHLGIYPMVGKEVALATLALAATVATFRFASSSSSGALDTGAIALQLTAGLATFALVALLGNLCGLRSLLLGRMQRGGA